MTTKKVQFEINCKDHDEIVLIGKSANFIFNPNTRNGEELFDFLSCCEEIPDKPNKNTGSFLKPNQKEHADEVFEFLTKKTAGDTTKDCECDKLQVDKAELLEALENIVKYGGIANFDTLKSLIQKMKQ